MKLSLYGFVWNLGGGRGLLCLVVWFSFSSGSSLCNLSVGDLIFWKRFAHSSCLLSANIFSPSWLRAEA